MPKKTYLGDAVYAEIDDEGFQLTLMTDVGDGPKDVIYLEPEVYRVLLEFVEREGGLTKQF